MDEISVSVAIATDIEDEAFVDVVVEAVEELHPANNVKVRILAKNFFILFLLLVLKIPHHFINKNSEVQERNVIFFKLNAIIFNINVNFTF